MGKLVTVRTGYSGVYAPLSIGFAELSAGNTFVFTDAEYAALPASVARAITLTTSGLPDPVRSPSPVPSSLDDAVTKEYADTKVAQDELVFDVTNFGAVGDNATDNYAAVTAAITACPAGGIVFFPPGQYLFTNTIAIPSNITLRGSWGGRWPQYGGLPVYLKPLFGQFLGTSLLSATETDGWRLEDITLQSGRATQVGTGNPVDGLFVAGACKAVRLKNVMVNNFSGYGIHTDTTSNGWPGGWEVSNIDIMNCALDGWRSDNTLAQTFSFSDSVLLSSESGANSGSGWYWAGVGAVDFLGLRSSFNTGGYGYAIVGFCSNVGFTECQTDRSGKDGYYLNAPEAVSANAPAPHIIMLTGCHASRDGKNNNAGQGGYAGFRVVGTSTSSPCMPVTLTGCQTHVSKDDNGTGQLSPDYGIVANNARKVLVNGCMVGGTVASVSDDNNAVVGGGGNVYYIVNFSTGVVSFDTAKPPLDNPSPTSPVAIDYSYKAWTYDPMISGGSTAPTGGVLYLSRIEVRSPISVSKIVLGIVSVAGIALTAAQCFAGIYNSAGTQVATTADISGGFATSGEVAFNLTGTVTLQPGQFYWAAMLLNGTTLPQMGRGSGQISNFGSGQGSAATRRFGSVGTAQTALPASFTPSTIAAVSANTYWFALV